MRLLINNFLSTILFPNHNTCWQCNIQSPDQQIVGQVSLLLHQSCSAMTGQSSITCQWGATPKYIIFDVSSILDAAVHPTVYMTAGGNHDCQIRYSSPYSYYSAKRPHLDMAYFRGYIYPRMIRLPRQAVSNLRNITGLASAQPIRRAVG